MTLVIDNISELITNDPELGDGPLGVVTDASVVIDGDTVLAVGPSGAVADERLDVSGRCVLPGFVDSPHPPGVRGRPGRGVHPADGGRALRRGWDPGHH